MPMTTSIIPDCRKAIRCAATYSIASPCRRIRAAPEYGDWIAISDNATFYSRENRDYVWALVLVCFLCLGMIKRILLAAMVGFCVPILWLILGFVVFNAHNGPLAALYYLGAHLLCPIFPVTSSNFEFGPPVNACLYGIGTWLILSIRRAKKDRPFVR